MDIRAYNRNAWDKEVERGNRWTIPVTSEEVAAARKGDWSLLLTPTIPVPRSWFPPDLHGIDLLCLASEGGQQGPILAAAGANVTVLDNSPAQLERDRQVAARDALRLLTVEGDMADLHMFQDKSFDLIFHPVSNLFVPDVLPVWREAYRVLRHGGILLAGISNPVMYIFDTFKLGKRELEVKHNLPYSDLDSLNEAERQQWIDQDLPLEFSHTLEEQIGGQLQAGFVLTGFYEDVDPENVLCQYTPLFISMRAVKL